MWRWLMFVVFINALSGKIYNLILAIINEDKNLALISLFWVVVFGWTMWLIYFHNKNKEKRWQRLVTGCLVNGGLIWFGYHFVPIFLNYFSSGQTMIGILLLPVVLVYAVLVFICVGRFKSYVMSGKDD